MLVFTAAAFTMEDLFGGLEGAIKQVTGKVSFLSFLTVFVDALVALVMSMLLQDHTN